MKDDLNSSLRVWGVTTSPFGIIYPRMMDMDLSMFYKNDIRAESLPQEFSFNSPSPREIS